jgi:hypothetical protein
MKNFVTKFFTTSLLIVSCISSTVMADTTANITVTKENNISETVVDNSSIVSNYIKVSPKSVVISSSDLSEKNNTTDSDTAKTAKWTETVRADIKIGEHNVNGSNGRKSFETATYIEEESSSSMFPVDAISYLMDNLSIEGVTTELGKNDKSVTINCDGKKITYVADSDKVLIDDKAKDIDNGAYSEMHNGKLFIPLRSLSNAIDCKIYWSGDEKTVTLKKTFVHESVVKNTEETTEVTTSKRVSTRAIVDSICGCNCPTSCYCKRSIGSCSCYACKTLRSTDSYSKNSNYVILELSCKCSGELYSR